MAPIWRVYDGLLGISEDDGRFSVPAAHTIFAARFGNAPPGIPSFDQTSDEVRRLEFDRFPAELRLSILSPSETTSRLPVRLSVKTAGGWRAVEIAAVRQGGHIVAEGRWIPLAPHRLEELEELLVVAGGSFEGGLTLRQLLKLRLAASRNGLLELDLDEGGGDEASRPEDAAHSQPAVAQLLYPYQAAGYSWLRGLAAHDMGGLLADEMGLGKTIQLIALMESRRLNGFSGTLVVGSTSIMENWRRELLRFAPQLRVLVHHGNNRTGSPATLRQFDVVVVSYDTLVRDAILLSQLKWDLVIADEAQYLKNPRTQRSVAVRGLPHRQFVASTGTPVENTLRDMWSLIDLAAPGLLGDESVFLNQFPDEPSAAARLSEIVAPLVMRRRVSEVASDLPSRIDIPTPLLFSEEEALKYEELRHTLATGGSPSIAALMGLRMFCAHPMLGSSDHIDPAATSVKYARLAEILGEIVEREEKVLIFASFTRIIDVIASDITSRFGISAVSIDGRTPATARQQLIDEFSAISDPAALILNPRAAGAGLNITAANHVVHYTPEWNPAVEDQASARAYRRGQTRPVTIHRLFYSDSVEEVMNERLQRKRVLISSAVVSSEPAGSEPRDILAALQRSPRQRSESVGSSK